MLTAIAVLPACAAHNSQQDPGSTSRPPTTAAPAVSTTTAVATTPTKRTEKWIDLAVGDCLADPPPTDPGVLTVTIVDCATVHNAEVYSRAPVAVNAAIADTANQQCTSRLPQYTGQSLNGSPYTITYLIDSNQDRTSANPTPSTVICLLQGANGQALTGSARR
ncbi:hypothetical protein [Mycobacterium sp.]|uniref:hypothetical protein n=1 Tax=Mycobacterium sp. TaxID=1785 RepID=UPI003D6BB86D